jgi:hypothetical protein
MKYTVVWMPSAEDRLAEIWISEQDRARVTAAADEIDRLLGTDPEGIGQVRTDKIRLLVEPPLGVYYEVLPKDMKAQVRAVWRWPE